LREWVAHHRDEIVEEPTSSQEIEGLLAVINRDLRDASVIESLDGQFTCTYWACLQIARTALRARGYRLRSTAHHFLAIESLEYTLGLDAPRLRQLQVFRAKRAAVAYETAGHVSDTELREARALAEYLKAVLCSWLHEDR
jgi:hypothetical protein